MGGTVEDVLFVALIVGLVALALDHVGAIDAGVGHADQPLARAGRRHRALGGPEDLGRAAGAMVDVTHLLGDLGHVCG